MLEDNPLEDGDHYGDRIHRLRRGATLCRRLEGGDMNLLGPADLPV